MSPTVFQDNESIGDDETLFRRIHVLHLVLDESTGLARISSGAFKDREMSVNIGSVIDQSGTGPQVCIANYPNNRLVALQAAAARLHGQAVCWDPLPEDLSHGLAYGLKNGKTPERLRSAAEWVIPAQAPTYKEIEAEKRAMGMLLP